MKDRERKTIKNGLLQFICGLIVLSLMFTFFASGITPPGVAGEVLRHNQKYDIDASPLFYSDVENMAELEEGVRILREKAANSTD